MISTISRLITVIKLIAIQIFYKTLRYSLFNKFGDERTVGNRTNVFISSLSNPYLSSSEVMVSRFKHIGITDSATNLLVMAVIGGIT